MTPLITSFVLIAGAVLAALAATLGMAGAVHVTNRRSRGYFHLVFYAILLVVALTSLLAGRDLSTNMINYDRPEMVVARHPVLALVQPIISLLILTISGERIITHWLKPGYAPRTPHFVFFAFVIFWLGTVGIPAVFSSHPVLSHDFIYPLVIGAAGVLVSGSERDTALRTVRDALMFFMLGGLLLVPISPSVVLDTSYGQGLIPGVPRLAGLAPHAVSMGLLSQLSLAILLVYPYKRVALNRLAWVVGLSVLFLAQSKTAWIAFLLCSSCIVFFRSGPTLWKTVNNPKRPEFGILVVLVFIASLLVLVTLVFFSDLDVQLNDFFATSQGAQLLSLTGRDRIWAVAYDEWQRSPVFGYGPTMWDVTFRAAVGMPFASHAHNQFMDTLSRSGAVGAGALIIYAATLLVLSIRFTKASRGLTLALFLGIVLRAVSEVPLLLFGYGPELIAQLILLIVITGCASEASEHRARAREKVQAQANFPLHGASLQPVSMMPGR